MSSFIFVCFIFALVPAILWIIPKTRRSSGMIMTALKTVPLGMLAFFALNHLPQNMALLSGTLCWAIIILLAAFIRKRYKANWKYPAFIFLVAIPFSVFCLAAAIATSIFCSTVRYFADSEHYHGEWFATAIPLPGESKTKLSLEQRSIHPFLAEYDYQLVFERDGRKTAQRLLTNTGGRTLFNLYTLIDGRLYLESKENRCIADPEEQTVLGVQMFNGQPYTSELPNETVKSFSGIQEKDGKTYVEYNNRKYEAHLINGAFDGKKYYGTIRSRKFYSAAEKPETKLTTLK